MDFGVFLPSCNNGFIISEGAPQFTPTYELNRDTLQAAERHGFKFALSLVKLRGFGGSTRMWDESLESFTLMSALAADTEKLKLYASVAVLTVHPAIVARMAATIDDISDGRFGVNIVSGWNKVEYDQMGVWPGDEYFSERYDYSTEYATILRQLWQDGVSDFKGKYFQLDDCRLAPTPRNHIDIVCAGASPRGLQFTTEFGDYSFMMAGGGVEGIQAMNDRLGEACVAAQRDIRSYCSFIVVLDDTDEAAERKVEHFRERADLEALSNIAGNASLDSQGMTASRINELRGGIFWDTEVVAGSPETVARRFAEFESIERLGGAMCCFVDWVEDVERFGSEVMPLLESEYEPAGV